MDWAAACEVGRWGGSRVGDGGSSGGVQPSGDGGQAELRLLEELIPSSCSGGDKELGSAGQCRGLLAQRRRWAAW